MSKEEIKKVKISKKTSVKKPLPVVVAEVVEGDERIGHLFANERIKRGLELRDVAEILRIRRVYLEAIETGVYAELPAQPYSTGFVSSYARFLGLNVNRMTQLFKEELQDKPRDKKGVFMIEDLASEASVPSKKYVVVGLVALVLIGLLWTFVYGRTETPAESVVDDTIEIEDIAVYEEPDILPQSAETAPLIDEATTEPELQLSQVIVTEDSFFEEFAEESKPPVVEVKVVKQDTWVEVRDRNKVYFNQVMKPGESYILPELPGLVLSVGKEDVEVLINGEATEVVRPAKKTNIALDPFIRASNH